MIEGTKGFWEAVVRSPKEARQKLPGHSACLLILIWSSSLTCCPAHPREEAYLTLRYTMVVRTPAAVLPKNLPSFLYASKRCSSKSDHQLCLLTLERHCSASLESPLSPLNSGSPSLESSSSSLLDGSTFSDAGAPTPMKQLAPHLVQERSAF